MAELDYAGDMRIGIDAHIILPKHKRYNPKIARYTENLIRNLIDSDTKHEHTWVLFFDERMDDQQYLDKFKQPNVEIRRFPFVQYRRYLPVVYSHMLISAFLRSAHLDVFHSPEGLIPFLYSGHIVASFHYVPRGAMESSLFARTFMMGARVAFAQLCRRAWRIVVNTRNDKKLLVERHHYPKDQVVLIEEEDMERIDWPRRVKILMKVYKEALKKEVRKTKTKPQKEPKPAKKKARKSGRAKKSQSKSKKRRK